MTSDSLGFRKGSPAQSSFQYLEDLATAYWYSEILFASIELDLFDHIEAGLCAAGELARRAGCHADRLERLLRALRDMALVHRQNGRWCNSPIARRYLLRRRSSYLGDFLLYRRYMQPRWQTIVQQVALNPSQILKGRPSPQDDYEQRNAYYVRALDGLARQKAREIRHTMETIGWQPPLLDIGSGAGALARALVADRFEGFAVLADLPEVLGAARRLYPDLTDGQQCLAAVACDVRRPPFQAGSFGLVAMSNILHAYGRQTARRLLGEGMALLAPGGVLLVHDYFPDRSSGLLAHRGALQDVNMMLNTYDGACHDAADVNEWLGCSGFKDVRVRDLTSDSTLIIARRGTVRDPGQWPDRARRIGFEQAVEIEAASVVTAGWVQAKCRFGCDRYGKGGQCPPATPSHAETSTLIGSYRKALLVVGQPPGRAFHQKLLDLEKEAFLAGCHKALVFGAGPCTVCESCPADGTCRQPSKARPSMEASGIDVYATARKAGLHLEPLRAKDAYVTYVGLLLLK